MNIGKVAQASGISSKMIRYYEEIGLIPPVSRQLSGYRVYTDKDLEQLKFIKRSRELGFSLEDIAELLELWNNKNRHSSDVKQLAQAHIQSIEQRIQDMQQVVLTLQDLIDSCAGDERPDCPILKGLEVPKCS